MRSPRRSHPETSVPASFTTEALVVFLVALLIRLLHLWQMQRSPFAGTLLGDALAYDTWARQIAGGDWLGHDVFYQTPLYPYFLGTLYSFNHSFALVRLCQAGIGAWSCVLLAFSTRRLFGNRAGLVAGLILAMYAPAVFFDGLIQKSVLDVFLICLSLMLLTDLGAEPTKPVRWFAVGVTLGVLALTRENALLFIGVVPVWLWIHHRRFGPARLTFAALLFAGAATVLVHVGLRNQLVGGEFHLTTAQFGPNFYIGNGPDADGTYIGLRPQRGRGMVEYERIDATELAEQATGLKLSPAQVSRYWTVRTLNGILAHPMRWIALEGRKVRWMWNATEMMDTESQDAYEEWSTVLSVLGRFAHFGVLAPLAVVGIWLTWKDRRQLWLVYALLGAYVVSVLAFYVLARYRYPMVPFLVIFAAAAIVNVKEISAMRPIRMGAGAALLVAATVFCNWPTAFLRDGMRAQTYVNLGERLLSDGHPEAAAAAYERAVASTPTDPDPRMTLGTLLIKQGALDRAIEQLDIAVHLRPDSAEA